MSTSWTARASRRSGLESSVTRSGEAHRERAQRRAGGPGRGLMQYRRQIMEHREVVWILSGLVACKRPVRAAPIELRASSPGSPPARLGSPLNRVKVL